MTDAPKPLDIAAEQAGIRRRSELALILCIVVLGPAVWGLPQLMDFPTEPGARLAFAARASLLIVLWIAVGVRMVSRVRFKSAADNPGSAFAAPSERIKVPLAFLQNTLEQAALAAFAMLALASVPGDGPLAFIVGSVVLFAIGRITFLRGYPHGAAARAFGMVTTALPIIGAIAWVVYDMLVGLARTAI